MLLLSFRDSGESRVASSMVDSDCGGVNDSEGVGEFSKVYMASGLRTTSIEGIGTSSERREDTEFVLGVTMPPAELDAVNEKTSEDCEEPCRPARPLGVRILRSEKDTGATGVLVIVLVNEIWDDYGSK